MLATRTHGGLFRHPFFRLDPAFNRVFQEAIAAEPPARRNAFKDAGDHYTLRVRTPGVAKEELELTLEGDVLTVGAEREVTVPEGYEAVRRERKSWRLHRSLALPRDADSGTVSAGFEDGVLTITIHKTEAPASRQIQIA
jgi:HSP20 family molecular chaperone IbpA